MTLDDITAKLIRFGDYTMEELGRDAEILVAFEKHMTGRQYGGPETLDAWHSFRAGWNARGAR